MDDLRVAGLMPRVLGSFTTTMLQRDSDDLIRTISEKLLDELAAIGLRSGRQQWGASRFELLEALPREVRDFGPRVLSHLVDLNLLTVFKRRRPRSLCPRTHGGIFRWRMLHADIGHSALSASTHSIGWTRCCSERYGLFRIVLFRLGRCGRAADRSRLAEDVLRLADAPPSAMAPLALSLAVLEPFPHPSLRRVS